MVQIGTSIFYKAIEVSVCVTVGGSGGTAGLGCRAVVSPGTVVEAEVYAGKMLA